MLKEVLEDEVLGSTLEVASSPWEVPCPDPEPPSLAEEVVETALLPVRSQHGQLNLGVSWLSCLKSNLTNFD